MLVAWYEVSRAVAKRISAVYPLLCGHSFGFLRLQKGNCQHNLREGFPTKWLPFGDNNVNVPEGKEWSSTLAFHPQCVCVCV